MTGSKGADGFIFKNHDGHDEVVNFNAYGDIINFRGASEIADFHDLAGHHIIQSGDDVVIDDYAGAKTTCWMSKSAI